MKVLIVCSKTRNRISPFITDQVTSLEKKGVAIEYFTINHKGILGYLKAWPSYLKKLKTFNPNIIHAHYGLSGLFANFQFKYPVVTTYHGSDINEDIPLLFSKLSIFLSKVNIFVSRKLAQKAGRKNDPVISCGVDMELFSPMDRAKAKEEVGLKNDIYYILFSSSFNNKVKNYPLAKAAIDILLKNGIKVELLEYSGYSRKQAAILFNAVDCVLVTSHKESGPLVIKEAMAVNTPAVSVDVGDVVEVSNGEEGYYISNRNPLIIANDIEKTLGINNKTNGRRRVLHLDLNVVAEQILEVYKIIYRGEL